MLFFTSVFVYKIHLMSPFLKYGLISYCAHFPLIIHLIVAGTYFVHRFEDCYMNEHFLMEQCYGTLICPVFLHKRIQGLIRKTAQLVLHWAHPAWNEYTNTNSSAEMGDEHQLWLHQPGRGRQGAAARN